MKILVTGARGQLGAELCRRLGPAGVGIDIDTLDVTDGPAVLATVGRLGPAAVIHCAAYTQVDRAESEPQQCRAINVAAVEHLARACRGLDCPLVQISTDYVFGQPCEPGRPWREDDPPRPQGVYAMTKLEGEQAAATAGKHLIVRTCGLYARPSQREAVNFVRTILRLARSRPLLRVVDDQRCTPSYVPHVARAILFLLERALGGPPPFCGAGVPPAFPQQAGRLHHKPVPWGTYHVTNAGETSWCEFAREIVRRAGLKVDVEAITTAEFGAVAPRPASSVLDTTRYQRLGGPPLVDWKTALAEYFEEERAL